MADRSPNLARRHRPRISAIWLPSAVLATLSILGAYHVLAGVNRTDVQRWREMAGTYTVQQLPHAWETDFNIRFLPSFSARTIAFGTQPKAVQIADPQNLVSPHGYVFVPEDVHVPYGKPFLDRIETRSRDALRVIATLGATLRSRNIHLLVVPVPAKASMLPQEVDPSYDPARGPLLNHGQEDWFAALRKAGVDVFDPGPAMWKNRDVAPLFYKTDTHWTQFAKITAAEAIAPVIHSWLGDTTPRSTFTERRKAVQYSGDSATADSAKIDIEQIQLLIGDHAAQFDDDAPVLVIGDSYAEQFTEDGAGFSQMLARALRVPVQNASQFGVQASKMAEQIDASPALLEKKKVVVLLFALRKIQCNDWIVPGQ